MLLNPVYFKFVLRDEIEQGELKEGKYWNTNDILLFQRFFGPMYSKLY